MYVPAWLCSCPKEIALNHPKAKLSNLHCKWGLAHPTATPEEVGASADTSSKKKQAWCRVECITATTFYMFFVRNVKSCEDTDGSKIGDVVFEDFNDFKGSKYKVHISRVQQLALSKAACEVPVPTEQLKLANAKQNKKPRAWHDCKKMFINKSTHELLFF